MVRSNQISDSRATSAATINRTHANFSPDPERAKRLFTIRPTPVPNIPNNQPSYNHSLRSRIISFISRKRILLPTFGVGFLVLTVGITVGLIGTFGSKNNFIFLKVLRRFNNYFY